MRTLLEIGLSNALVACVPAIAAIVAGLCLRRPALCHALWLLVLLKLVTPPLFRVDLPWPADPAPVETVREEAAPAPAPAPVREPEPAAEVGAGELLPPPRSEEAEAPAIEGVAAPQAEAVPPPVEDEPPAAEVPPAAWAVPWPETIAALWLLGSLGWFGLAARRAWSFARALRQATGAPEKWYDRVAALSALVGLRECPEVRLVPGRLAPMVWGTFRPVLLLPAGLCEQLSGTAMDTLIVHELAHLRRRDHWVRVLEFVALGLFWWHPLAWYACRELRRAEEQCCDAWVVRVLPGAARAYAVALVDALDYLSEPRPTVPPLACGIGEMADLKRRLTMILSRSTKHSLGWTAGLAVLALGGVLLLTPGVGEAQNFQPKPKSGESFGDADLKKIQDELRHKMQEIEALQKKAAEIEKARAQDAKRKADLELAKVRGRDGGTIRIEISGFSGKKEDIEKLAAALEKALGKESKVIILRSGQTMQGKGADTIPPQIAEWIEIWKKKGGQDQKWEWKWGPPGAMQPAPKTPATVVPPKVPGQPGDKRVESLEKKLDDIMKELEAIRKELKARPGPRPGGKQPGGLPPGGAQPAK